MAKPLFDRIAADLKPTGRIADCRRDLAEAERERANIGDKIAEAVDRAEDPAVAEADAKLAQQQADDWRLYARRLDRGIAQLKEAIAEKEADESYAARRRDFEEAESQRDALVERWRALQPLWDALPALLNDTLQNDRLLARVNNHRPQGADRLQSAEIVARGALNDGYWPNSIGMNGEPFTRLTAMRLPNFAKPGEMKPGENLVEAVSASVEAGIRSAAAARSPEGMAEARKIEEARWKRYEVRQDPYRGSPIMGVLHRTGAAAVGNKPVTLEMHVGQVARAQELGLKLKPLPVEAQIEEAA